MTAQLNGPSSLLSIDQSGLGVQADAAIGEFTSGVRINGIGGDGASIGGTLAGEFHSTEVRYTPPSTWTFIAQTRPVTVATSTMRLSGQVGFEMRAVFIPNPAVPAPDNSPGFWQEYRVYILAAAIVVTVVALQPELIPLAVGAAGQLAQQAPNLEPAFQ